jgi:hypothetical protein
MYTHTLGGAAATLELGEAHPMFRRAWYAGGFARLHGRDRCRPAVSPPVRTSPIYGQQALQRLMSVVGEWLPRCYILPGLAATDGTPSNRTRAAAPPT